jgi:enoyl-CoA hydratase
MHELNLISRLAAPKDLESSAQAIIDRLAANAPLSLRAIKALIVRQMAFRDGIGHQDIDALVDNVRASKDAEEGTRARVEKRRPRFTGT